MRASGIAFLWVVLSAAAVIAQSQAVVTTNAPIFIGPVISQTPLRVAAVGTTLKVVGEQNDWVQVEFQDPQFGRRIGWVQRDLVKVSNPALQPMDLSVHDTPESRSNSGTVTSSESEHNSLASRALAALSALEAATEVGMLRTQYSDKLVELLPVVREFVKSGSGWQDVRLAMAKAEEHYKAPMESLDAWGNASTSMSAAAVWVDYSKSLAALPNEEHHEERQEIKAIGLGDSVSGRLGFGDVLLPKSVDWSAAGGFHDRYELSLGTATRVLLRAVARPCSAHLVVTDAGGKKIEGDFGLHGNSSIKRALPAGKYSIWVGTMEGEIGNYTLAVDTQR